ncbi:Lysine-specific demethylase NO66 [Quillaja saponaria]|uniref:Bifunctional lysine-specific demethylase and histidyl-hydroxylase n=1 Tax=Quillaja saponaria TaxID=32244 RepID=A0AAD7QDS0_QUISA|nr:Lysine-specific demethylase NO66 [Quillaja saponaria]
MSACNAVLHLSKTTFGQLLEFSALEKLMFVFLQIRKFSKSVALCSKDDRSVTCLKINLEEDEFPVSILNVAIILINSSVIEQLQKIPSNLSEVFLTILKELWKYVIKCVAAIADTLAFLFGQPSAGANLYLTPPNSQGLACYSDDHCVFVCQIFGSELWKVFSWPSWLLPHLYDPLHSPHGHGSDVDNSAAECREFWLREGDILYIPRGYPLEAHINSSSDDGSAGGRDLLILHFISG